MVCNSSKSILSFKDRQFHSISGSFVQSTSGSFVYLFVLFDPGIGGALPTTKELYNRLGGYGCRGFAQRMVRVFPQG